MEEHCSGGIWTPTILLIFFLSNLSRTISRSEGSHEESQKKDCTTETRYFVSVHKRSLKRKCHFRPPSFLRKRRIFPFNPVDLEYGICRKQSLLFWRRKKLFPTTNWYIVPLLTRQYIYSVYFLLYFSPSSVLFP